MDVMAGGGGAAGQAPLIRHQEPGNLAENATCTLQSHFSLNDSYPIALAVCLQCSCQACKKYAEGHGFEFVHAPF